MLENVRNQIDSTVGPLVSDIVQDMQKLVQQEVVLAKTEIKENLDRIKNTLISSVFGILFLAIALVMFAFGGVLALLLVDNIQPWCAYLVIGGALSVLALGFFVLARNQATAIKGMPEKTLETIKENVEWIQQKM